MTLQVDIDQMMDEATNLVDAKHTISNARDALDTTDLTGADFSFLGMEGPYKVYTLLLDLVKSQLWNGAMQFDDAAGVLRRVAHAFQFNDVNLSTEFNAWNPNA